jgi:osomolarity two-component system sensor histidine kinase SLN1
MPNLDGLQSTRLIRQMGYSAPIVALTAFAEESNVKECYDSGMDMFLRQAFIQHVELKRNPDLNFSKPIRRPALKQVLKKFSTIPEEAETSSLTGRSTPDGETPAAIDTPPITPLANGTSSSHSD